MSEPRQPSRSDDTPEHLFDQTNGVAGAGDEGDDRSDVDRAVQKARDAVFGATGAAGWGR